MSIPVSGTNGAASTAFLSGNVISRYNGDNWLRESPDTHHMRAWGSPVVLPIYIPSVGASQAVTTVQGMAINPFPYAYLYDIIWSVTAHDAVATDKTIDVWDTTAAGAVTANSYLTSPFTITASLASAARGSSARFMNNPVYNKDFDPQLYAGGTRNTANWSGGAYTGGTRNIPLLIPQGQIFSVRCSTPAAGSLTNLSVHIILVPSDCPGIIDRL